MTKKQAAGFGFKMVDRDWFMRESDGLTFMIGPTNEDFPKPLEKAGLWVSLDTVLSYYLVGRTRGDVSGIQTLMVKARVLLRRVEEQEWETKDELAFFLRSEDRFFEGEMVRG